MAMSQRTTLSVERETHERLRELARQNDWSVQDAVRVAVETLDELMSRHEGTSTRASDPDVGRLFLQLARLAPAMLTDCKVEEARFSDGRPALILDETWVFAPDNAGQLMVAKKDGTAIGRIEHGRIEAQELTPAELAPAHALLN
jgi:hypothetical protein